MISRDACLAILDTIPHPIVFVDNEHIVRYLNRAAEQRYYRERGYGALIGKSLQEVHQTPSWAQVLALHERLARGENEIYLKVNKYGERVTIVAVRDAHGVLLGYYERFEKVPTSG